MNQDPVVPGSQNSKTAAEVGAAPSSPSSSSANDGTVGATEVNNNFTSPSASSAVAGAPVSASASNSGQASVAQPDPMAANLNQIPAAQPILSNVATPSMVEPAKAPKPKRTGLIVTIVLLILLLLAGGGFALWYFLFYNNPENIAFEAINGFLREKNVVTTGQMWGEYYDSDRSGSRMEIELKNSSAGLAGVSDIVLSNSEFDVEHELDEEGAYELTLGSVMMSDGVFYLRIGQLMDTVDKFIDDSGLTKEDLPDSYQVLYQLGEIVDEEWWEVSPIDIIDTITEEVDNLEDLDEITYLKDFYRCAVDVANQDIGKELAEIYKNNRFLKITKVSQSSEGHKKPDSGNSLYLVEYDYQKMADFINALPKSHIAEQAYTCYNNYRSNVESESSRLPEKIDADFFDEITAKDLEDSRDANTKQYLEISNWGHELKGVFIYGESRLDEDGEENADGELYSAHEVDLQFTYSPVTVDAPAESRPITDLIEELKEIITNLIVLDGPVYDPETGEIIDIEDDWGDTWDDEDEPWSEEV